MKLKEQKKFGILWLSIGAALFLAGLLLGETEYGSYISGFGGGLIGNQFQFITGTHLAVA